MPPVRVLTRSDVERLLSAEACVAAVEDAFRQRGMGAAVRSGILGVAATHGGFHVKAALMATSREYFAAKVNANFPGNPAAHGLPTIQGVLALFDARNGVPLALMDSMALTILRTAAASAVAAKYLALPGARTVTLVGCGAQAMAQLRAMQVVRPIAQVRVIDTDARRQAAFAAEARSTLGIDVAAAEDMSQSTRTSEIVITCTTSRTAFLGSADLSPGAFVAAVGADNEHKHEIAPELLARSVVVADSLEQCSTIGDLHHAIDAGVMRAADVRAELADVVTDPARGRRGDDEIVVFDSTGVAFQDVAAAAIVHERAEREGLGTSLTLDE